jgi:hypothetical protein
MAIAIALFGKPVSIFRDHALKAKINARFRAVLICCSAA